MKKIYIVWMLLVSLSDSAYPNAYKGIGGQIEAYGEIMGTYYAALAFIEICSADPIYTTEAEKTARNYLSENKPLLDNVRNKLDELAIKNGGEKERLRLKTEINNALHQMKSQLIVEAKKQVINEKSCANILANLRKGVMDIKTQRRNEVEIITGAFEQPATPAILKGILDGCIDGQKRLLTQQGLSYQENEEVIRNYCHCMAPITMDIVSTADGRAKLMDGDPVIKARVQKVETICLDGLKNGRKFAPN
jgi:hypothetical protein